MHMNKPVLLTAAVSLFAPACTSDESVDGSGDALAETDPIAAHEQPDDIDVGDPFLAALDHVWAGPAGAGFAIAGYDANDVEIGRISVYPMGPEVLRMTHRYPRPCVIENSGEVVDAIEDCADFWDVTVSLAGEPEDHWHDVYQTLPANMLLQRMQAMEIMVTNQPQALGENLGCVFGILAPAPACLAVVAPWAEAITCPASVYAAVCACKKQAKKLFPELDFEENCP
jgi:hypothetical protein